MSVPPVQIASLNPARHAAALFEALHRPDAPSVWTHLRDGPFATAEALAAHLAQWISLSHVRGFALCEGPEGRARGVAGLIARVVAGHPILPEGRYGELAFVVVDPRLHGTGFALSGARLLLARAFADPDLRGCLWRCDARNVASERFALKLGFTLHATAPDGEAKGQKRVSRFFHLLRPISSSLP